ncbi:MAG TPA: secretion system protein F, partial [Candidatus Omnitrophica bacterium]|nr:secretion system protein F [Candidatus Omnitrophota bacterium]
TLCVGAGLDFLNALNRIVTAKGTRREPLIEELSLVLHEIRLGKRRGEALKTMATRIDLPEIRSFVRTLVQADRMGTPIVEAL